LQKLQRTLRKDLSLTKEDYAEIDGIIKDITASLKENGASYSDWYGKGVTKKDVRKCYELIYLATNFAEYMQEKYELELDEDTDNKIVNKYVEDHKEDFYTAEVLKYVISVAGNKYETDALYDAAVLKAKDAAAKISGATGIEEFFSLIEEYESELAETETEETTEGTGETTTEDTTEDVTTEGTTKEETSEPTLEEKVEDNKVVIEYESGNDLGDWLFGSEDNSAAEEGDCSYFVETETKEETTKKTKEVEETTEGATSGSSSSSSSSSSTAKKTYEVTNVTIYYVLSPSSINTDKTHDFGYIVSSDKKSLETFVQKLNEAIKSGKMTKEKFVEIAEALKGELSSDITTFEYNSGEKQAEGVFKDTYKAMNEWLEDDARKDGDISDILTIKVDSKTTNYAVLFFEGHNEATWYVAAYAGVVSEKFDEWYEAELKAKPLTFNTDALEKINTIRFYNN